MPAVRLYWKIIKPRTFGVKVALLHPQNQNLVLLVRHSYGDQQLWNLPGGGFNPKKETAIVAAEREVLEELNTKLENVRELCLYQTSGEGKRDTVTVFTGSVSTEHFVCNQEIAEYKWFETSEVFTNSNVARVARQAVRALS